MVGKSTPPSISETAFDCPYCGAFTTQNWFLSYAYPIYDEPKTPFIINEDFRESIINDKNINPETRNILIEDYEKLASGLIYFVRITGYKSVGLEVNNIFLSQCYNCNKIAIWVHDKLLFPPERYGEQPNSELSEDILHDYEEARSVLNLSPRAAAALLRLCVQKLCILLGEKGENINDDIASLVKKGLPIRIQQSLDIVRVVGNNAVHPGQIDLKDDRDTATKLFGLVNIIAETMIAQPNSIEAMYRTVVPESQRKAIEKRDSV